MTFSEGFFELFNRLLDQVGIAVDWTAQNAVPYVMDLGNRIVWFDTAKHALFAFICLVVIIVCLIIFFKNLKAVKTVEHYYQADGYEMGMFLSGIFGITAIVLLCFTGVEIVQNLLLPEVTIIEMLQNLMGGM